jgi:hypothetical protein
MAASELKISYKALLYKIKQYNLSPPPRKRQVAIEKAREFERVQSA